MLWKLSAVLRRHKWHKWLKSTILCCYWILSLRTPHNLFSTYNCGQSISGWGSANIRALYLQLWKETSSLSYTESANGSRETKTNQISRPPYKKEISLCTRMCPPRQPESTFRAVETILKTNISCYIKPRSNVGYMSSKGQIDRGVKCLQEKLPLVPNGTKCFQEKIWKTKP